MAIITNLSPAPGEAIAADQAVSFDVIDPLISELRVYVWAVFADSASYELVYDSENFSPSYSFATITPATGGRTFSIQRVGGWPSAPELRVDTCACPPEVSSSDDSGSSTTTAGGWREVYRVDFRDVFTSLGAVDLNTPGATVVIDGVTWQTSSVAVNGSDMATSVSFGITANGLEVVGAGNGRANPGVVTAQAIWASLFDLANNTSTPFDADPTQEYLIQAYVSAGNADANHEMSGVFAFREDALDPVSNNLPGDPALYRTFYGFINSVGPDALEGTGGTSTSPSRITYRPADFNTPVGGDYDTPNVPTLHYKYAGHFQHGGAPWDTVEDDFPGQSDLQFFSVSRDATDVENDVVAHPRFGFFCGVGHVCENSSDNYNAVIQQYRILQK